MNGTKTVREFIERLQEFDPDLPVVCAPASRTPKPAYVGCVGTFRLEPRDSMYYLSPPFRKAKKGDPGAFEAVRLY